MTLRYAYYGDDFTGSTDVLEQLSEGGVPAVLFLRIPDEKLRARFPDAEAIGIAGDSRSRSPKWMEENLPAAYASLQKASVVHYKTCSTFDSSPSVGSIGKAMDIGLDQFDAPAAIVVAAPYIGRYVSFGILFATAGDEIYRIDRHPTMAHHPVTPMHEPDLIKHLALQTDLNISKLTLSEMENITSATSAFDAAREDAKAVLFDGMTLEDLETTGAVLLARDQKFIVGSSGVTRALVLEWRKRGLLNDAIDIKTAKAVEQILVVSGSCSPVTAKQVFRASEQGYKTLSVDVSALLRDESSEARKLIAAAGDILSSGSSCVIHTADGPLGASELAAGDRLGSALGRITKAIVEANSLRRIIFAGGDTSSHGVAQLGVDALTFVAPIEVGAPLVKAHAEDSSIDGLEMVLKGGQMGGEDFFETVRSGRSVPSTSS